jgi:hypothetical protein
MDKEQPKKLTEELTDSPIYTEEEAKNILKILKKRRPRIEDD